MERLFVDGTLQPGGPNEHILSAIGGTWEPAIVRGKLVKAGWGSSMGYPGLAVDGGGEHIAGSVFTSSNLGNHWADLDEFEGADYQRIVASVAL